MGEFLTLVHRSFVSPVVHQQVWRPHQFRMNPDAFDSTVCGFVPLHLVIMPLLRIIMITLIISIILMIILPLLMRMNNRAHREIKNQNRDSHTWIFIGNWILNLICFLQFFDLSTPSAAKMRFYFLHFLQGKNAQNRPENQQNWNLAKIGLKSDNFMK